MENKNKYIYLLEKYEGDLSLATREELEDIYDNLTEFRIAKKQYEETNKKII